MTACSLQQPTIPSFWIAPLSVGSTESLTYRFQVRGSALSSSAPSAARIEPLSDDVLIGAAALTLPMRPGHILSAAVTNAARNAIVHGVPLREALTARLLDVFDPTEVDRDAFCLVAYESLGMTQREIARLLSVSHPTVGAAIRRARETL